MARSGYLRGFSRLALANWRELTRDPKMIIYIFIPPLLVLAIFPLIGMVTNEKSVITVVLPSDAEPRVVSTVQMLQQVPNMSFQLVDEQKAQGLKESGKYEALVVMPKSLEYGTISIDTPDSSDVKVYAIKAALDEATRKAGSPTVVVKTPGGFYADPMRFGTVGSLVYALASLAVFGIATPIVTMRQRGILRLLGTTPVSRLTFVLAQVPARLCLGVGMTLATLAFVYIKWDVGLPQLAAAFVTAMLGFCMLAAIGYLFGGVMTSPEATFAVLSPLLTFGSMAGAVFFPLDTMPIPWLKYVPPFVPLSYLADALRQELGIGGKPLAPQWVDHLALVAITVVLTVLAVRCFRWDQTEQGYKGLVESQQ